MPPKNAISRTSLCSGGSSAISSRSRRPLSCLNTSPTPSGDVWLPRLFLLDGEQGAILDLAAAQPIDRPAAGDQHQPGRDRRTARVVAAGLVPDLEERLLEDLLGIRGIAQDAMRQAQQHAREAVVEQGQRRGFAGSRWPRPAPGPARPRDRRLSARESAGSRGAGGGRRQDSMRSWTRPDYASPSSAAATCNERCRRLAFETGREIGRRGGPAVRRTRRRHGRGRRRGPLGRWPDGGHPAGRRRRRLAAQPAHPAADLHRPGSGAETR